MFLMGAGAITILLLASLGGFWLVVIGWFLMRASRGTLLQEVLEERLGGVTAREAMAEHCPRAAGDETLWNAMRRMDDLRVHQLPVVSSGRLLGVLTREQLVRVISNPMDLGQDG